MSDTNTPGSGNPTTTPDPLNNFKSEVDRKISALQDPIKQLAESQKVLMAQLEAMQKSSAPAAKEEVTEDIDDLWYSKPAAAAAKIKEQTKAELRREFEAQNAETTKRNNVLTQLVQEYPELSSNNSDLTKKAIEIYNALPQEEQVRPMSYRLAVKEAAAELGVKPASKREDSDYYSVGASGGTAPASRKRDDELDPNTEAFAKLMGVDLVKVKERARSRKNWSRYE